MQKTNRLDYLDYLRGYFVVVIITDHLWRYPSLFSLITGEARLWMTAAEGFVMISGFLIGYVRGFKGRKNPLLRPHANYYNAPLFCMVLW